MLLGISADWLKGVHGPMYAARIDLLFESALLLAAVCFALSLYVLSKGLGNKLYMAYSALTLNVSLWAFAFFVGNVLRWRLFESVHLIATLLIGPLSLIFLSVFLTPKDWFFKGLAVLSFIAATILMPLVILGLDRYGFIRDVSYYSPTLLVLAMLYLFVSEVVGGVKPRGAGVTRRIGIPQISGTEMLHALRRRNLWIYVGGAFVTMLCVMDRIPALGRTVPSIGNFLLAMYFYFVKDAVLQQAWMSPRRTLARIVSNAAGAFAVFSVIFLLTTWVVNNPTLYLINAFLAAFVSVATLDPIRSLANSFFRRFFFKEAKRIDDLIREASKEIAGAFQPVAIAEATKKFLAQALESSVVSFYALESNGQWFRKVLDQSNELNLPEYVPAAFPLVQRWQKERGWHPVIDTDLETESSHAAFESKSTEIQLVIDAIHSLHSNIAIPLKHQKIVVGFVTLMAKDPDSLWDASWTNLPLLESYFTRAGEALHELDIYMRLRDRDRLATVGEMAAGLAHEIRNPLGAIKGAAQVLDPKPGDPQEPMLKIIIDETNRLNRVVSQFLNYAKPFQSPHEFARLSEHLTKTLESWRRQRSAEMPFEFRTWIPATTPEIRCQPELISQVVVNLLDNALHALIGAAQQKPKDWRPMINCRLEYANKQGKVDVRLSVEDNGPGMAPELVDKIFIPFFTATPKGTGLGLSICQKIAEAHGGHMEVESQLGDGTKMHFCFESERSTV